MTATRTAHRAACVAALYELDRAGWLEGLTLQDLANMLDLGHRSTAMRYMRDVAALHDLVPELRDLVRQALPMIDDPQI